MTVVEHELIRESLGFGSGWRCERCRLWFGTAEIAAEHKCLTPAESAKRRQERPPSEPRVFCTCERRKARLDKERSGQWCSVCKLAWRL